MLAEARTIHERHVLGPRSNSMPGTQLLCGYFVQEILY